MSAKSMMVALMAALALGACGDGNAGGGFDRGGSAPSVVGGEVSVQRFADTIEAVGTARANEQVVLTAPVTDRIEAVNFSDGEDVARGAVIARLARGEEAADLNAVEARAREAQQQLGRLNELKERGFATNANVDAQVALRDAARADASAIREQIADRVVRAPFAGTVGLRTVSAGAVVSAGEAIATLSDLSRIKLDFTVPERLLASLAPGQTIEARAAAYPGEVFRGDIDGIDPVVDTLSRSVTVRAILPNPDRRLRPGMLLSVEIVSDPRQALAVPETALVAQGSQNFVFRVDEEGIARRTAIETGARADGYIEVTGGIERGARIVADGTVKVRDDAPVTLKMPGERPPTAESGAAQGASL